MYQINEDKSIYVTRGDIVLFEVTAEDNGEVYTFQPGDLVRIKVFGKKNCDNVVLQKDFPVTSATESVEILLDENDTKIGEVINKPTDYWYEIELNPLSDPQTIVGYNEDGPAIFRLFPEGRDLESDDPVIAPEDIPIVDTELDLTSPRPVQNQAVTRAIIQLDARVTKKAEAALETANRAENAVKVEKARIDNFVSGATAGDEELVDIRVGAFGTTFSSAGMAVRSQFQHVAEENDLLLTDGFCFLKGGFQYGKIDNTGAEYAGEYRVKSVAPIRYDRDIVLTVSNGFRCALHYYNEDGTYASETGWVTGNVPVVANTLFRVVIARETENTEETAPLLEFVRAITITTAISELIEDVKTMRDTWRNHENSGTHLVISLLSNNIADAEQFVIGGYYAFNDGQWKERADISTTGLIPCEKGQVYYCGIDFENQRGGNCTFWDADGLFVSGINVADGREGFTIPDNDQIKYFRISFYTSEKDKWHINLGEYQEYDAYKSAYAFDKEIVTPSFDSTNGDATKTYNELHYIQTYKDDVSVHHKRNNKIGTSYQLTIINKEKFDGTQTKVTIEGTSPSNPLGDTNNANVETYAKRKEFLHIVNGGIYLVANGEADGITIINGSILKSAKVEQFDEEQYVLGITASGEMKTYLNESADSILADGCVYALTGFVPLIQGGEAVTSSVLSVCPHYNARHPRQIVGILSDGNYFTFCCDGRIDGENGMTLQECIDTILDDLSVEFAFNLDGGGSTQTAVGKKQINRVIDGRTIPNVIAFR